MARLPRLIVAGLPHLLSQRVQHGQALVRDGEDRDALLRLLREGSLQHGVALHAYAITESRLDLVATPDGPTGASLLMQAVARRHAAAYNRRHARSGGLWEGRFRAAVVEPETWLLRCMMFVEQLSSESPAVATCSSRPAHSGQAPDALVTDPPAYWALGNTPFEREAVWRMRMEQALTLDERNRIQAALRGGWVLGSTAFAEGIGRRSGRPSLPRKSGRPRNQTVPDKG